jgi:hypothetical protein
MRKKSLPTAALAAALALASGLARAQIEVPAEVRAKAAAIFAALEKIEAEAGRPVARQVPAAPPQPSEAPGSRRLTFSEAEFNAYVACRLADENEAYVRSAEFKLLAGDKIEGRIAIDLGKPQAAGVVPQRQDLLFAAGFETQDGKIRITMDRLFLGTQPISPAFVDIIIGVVSRLQGLEPTSLKDWYDLPPGVLRLETQPGRVVVVY